MLKKKNRLNLSNPINILIFKKKNNFFYSSKYFLSYSRKNEKHLKLTIIIPKKIVNKAVDRNYYRRQLYLLVEEFFLEENKKFSEIEKDFVFVLKKTVILTGDKKSIKDLLKNDLRKLLKEVI